MAIYQVVIELIPNAWVKTRKDFDALYPETGFYDLSVAWADYKLESNLENLLGKLFQQKGSWSSSIKIWGDDEHSDIKVSYDENSKIESIMIRLDLRENIEALKSHLLLLARKLNCSFFFPETRMIVEADAVSLNKEILKSASYRYLNDQENFFEDKKK